MSKSRPWLPALSIIMLVAACDASQPVATTSTPDSSLAPVQPAAGDASPVMSQPLNGQSVASFEASLAEVARQASEDEYRKLENAIGYLLIYDLSVKRDKARLYAKLDGKTPLQIVEKAAR